MVRSFLSKGRGLIVTSRNGQRYNNWSGREQCSFYIGLQHSERFTVRCAVFSYEVETRAGVVNTKTNTARNHMCMGGFNGGGGGGQVTLPPCVTLTYSPNDEVQVSKSVFMKCITCSTVLF